MNVTITPVDDPPALTGTPASSVSAGDFYVFTPTLVDPDVGDPPDAANQPLYACTNCPVWADFDPASGTVQGVPETGQEGLYPDIRLSVTTAGVSADLAPFEIQDYEEDY